MGLDIVNPPIFGKVEEGFNLIASGLPNGVWNTISLDPSVAKKTVEIHIRNSANVATSRGVLLRQLDDNGNPIGSGNQILVGGGSTTSFMITTNKNAQIQVQNLGNGVSYRHMNTLK